MQWQDIAPFFRDFSATYQGKVYTIPLDGDFQMIYYRSDLLAKDGVQPPATWDDYLAIAKKYQGQDLNGDGTPDYGSCISMKRNAQAYWFIMSVGGAYLQSKGTGQGAFFDATTMKPLTNNDAFAQGPGHLQGDAAIRAARRTEPGRGGHARPVHLRALRALDGLGRHRHARH